MKIINSIITTMFLLYCVGCSTMQYRAEKELKSRNIKFNNTNFEKYVYSNQLDIVKLFLDAGMSPRGVRKGSMLMYACQKNNLSLAKLLIEYGADINEHVCNEAVCFNTPLKTACAYNSEKIVLLLLNNGAKVNNVINKQDEGEIHAAFYSNNPQIIKMLIKHGACVNINDNLYWACKTGNIEIIRLILNNGNFNERERSYALLGACESNKLDVIQFILQTNVNTNVIDKFTHKSALDYVIDNDNQDAISLLRKYGAKTADELKADNSKAQ